VFAIEEWHGYKMKREDKKKLVKILEHFQRSSGEVYINE